MHNRIYIGRQVMHFSNYQTGDEICKACRTVTIEQISTKIEGIENITSNEIINENINSVTHLLVDCPTTREAWDYLKTRWLEISGSFEDFIDIDFIEITTCEKLIGMPTPGKNIDKISLLFINIKDIFIGNMQKTIYDSHKRSYFNKVALTPVNLIQQWRHKMTHSVNIIVNRLRQRNKPKG